MPALCAITAVIPAHMNLITRFFENNAASSGSDI